MFSSSVRFTQKTQFASRDRPVKEIGDHTKPQSGFFWENVICRSLHWTASLMFYLEWEN